MKVRELMEALSAFDPELPVIMPGETADHCEVTTVLLDYACREEGSAQLEYPADGGGEVVVRLVGPAGPGEDYYRNASADED